MPYSDRVIHCSTNAITTFLRTSTPVKTLTTSDLIQIGQKIREDEILTDNAIEQIHQSLGKRQTAHDHGDLAPMKGLPLALDVSGIPSRWIPLTRFWGRMCLVENTEAPTIPNENPAKKTLAGKLKITAAAASLQEGEAMTTSFYPAPRKEALVISIEISANSVRMYRLMDPQCRALCLWFILNVPRDLLEWLQAQPSTNRLPLLRCLLSHASAYNPETAIILDDQERAEFRSNLLYWLTDLVDLADQMEEEEEEEEEVNTRKRGSAFLTLTPLTLDGSTLEGAIDSPCPSSERACPSQTRSPVCACASSENREYPLSSPRRKHANSLDDLDSASNSRLVVLSNEKDDDFAWWSESGEDFTLERMATADALEAVLKVSLVPLETRKKYDIAHDLRRKCSLWQSN